jgi:hypothetical protein
VYTKIDLCGAYNLGHIRKCDEWKMVFITHYGHFEYVVMPFGLTNALVVFQHMMNDVFHENLDDFVVCYIDYILIFSKNMADHQHHVHIFWKSFEKLIFMPNWKNVDSMNLRWNSWVILFLEMAFAWTFISFKSL